MKILVVDDEETMVRSLSTLLAEEGYEVTVAADGPQALEAARAERPDLILLDVMLPGVDGMEVCRQIRTWSTVPIIMLTAKTGEVDKVVGLEVGADDYVTKPFSPRELVSRVKAVLRRTETAAPAPAGKATLQVDDRLSVNFDRREVLLEGKPVKLRPTEYRLLYHLVNNAGWVVPHDQLLAKVWGYEYREETHYLRLYVNYLRQKLEKDPANPKYILTERGVGYRFVDFRKQQESEK